MVSISQLGKDLAVGTTPTDLVTAAANVSVLLKKVTVFNGSAAVSVKLTTFVIPAGGTASDANTYDEQTITPRKTVEIYSLENHVLLAGDVLQGQADASGLVVQVSGLKVT